MSPVFADGVQIESWWGAVGLVLVFLTTGGGMVQLLNALRTKRKDAMDEWQQTVADLRTDREADRKEIHDLREKANLTALRLELCERDRAQLREDLSRHGIPLRPAPESEGKP